MAQKKVQPKAPDKADKSAGTRKTEKSSKETVVRRARSQRVAAKK